MRKLLNGVAAIALLSGCTDPNAPIPIQTAPVNGVATYDGKPLEDFRVFFYADGAAAQEPATARIAEDGSFTLSVRQPNDGANVGKNSIWFAYDPILPEETPGLETGKAPPPPKVALPKKFLSKETSGLSVEVTNEGLKDYQLKLTGK